MYEPFKIGAAASSLYGEWAILETETLALLRDANGNIVTYEAEDRAFHQCVHLNLELEFIALQKHLETTNKLLGDLILKLKEHGIDVNGSTIGENN